MLATCFGGFHRPAKTQVGAQLARAATLRYDSLQADVCKQLLRNDALKEPPSENRNGLRSNGLAGGDQFIDPSLQATVATCSFR